MKESRHQNISLPIANKSHHCIKVNCTRRLPSNHLTSYTNGLCERHFFEIDLPPNDDSINLDNKSKEEKIDSTKTQYQPLRDDIRETREVFDGYHWQVINQQIHPVSTRNIDNIFDMMTTKINNEENFLKIVRLLSNYRTIKDELKTQQ